MNDDSYVLTLELDRIEAASAADTIREIWPVEPVEISRVGDDRVWIETYWPSEAEAEAAGRDLAARLPVKGRAIRKVTARDWQAFWKHHFHARPIGTRLMICPEWERDTVDLQGRVPVYINPGLSFGTGDHFTTRFCLEILDAYSASSSLNSGITGNHIGTIRGSHLSKCDPPGIAGSSFLDAGCGSGILAIAAVRLGVQRIAGFDYDEGCVEQARENARLNGVGDRIEWMVHDLKWEWTGGAYDLVCANVFSSLLMDRAPDLWRMTARRLALSGMRESELDAVADAYLTLGAREHIRDGDGEWGALVFERR